MPCPPTFFPTRVADSVATIALGSPKRIYFDAEMGDALTAALEWLRRGSNIRVVVLTGGAPGYFARHFSITSLLQLAEPLRASGRQWPDNATYNAGFFDKAMALCEKHAKTSNRRHFRNMFAGAFEFALSCDLRIAEDGDYLIGLPETNLGLIPGPAARSACRAPLGRRRSTCTSSWAMPSTRRKQPGLGLSTESVSGKALDRAMQIARRLRDPTAGIGCGH